MSKSMITDSLLTAIANVIRAKASISDEMTPSEMATAISNIELGITPTGSTNIEENGTFDVTNYASAVVNVPSSGFDVNDLATNAVPTGAVTLAANVTAIAQGAFYKKPLTSIYAPEVTVVNQYAFWGCPNLQKASFPKLTSLGNNNWYQFQESKIQQLSCPKLSNTLPTNILQACTSLTTVDAGVCSSIASRAMAGATNFDTLILRKTSAITTLANIDGIASSTKFKSGGAGGTIYIPTVLYNHLGDGTALDYQSASQWSTVYGYGTITWAKLEGSAYESESWLTI